MPARPSSRHHEALRPCASGGGVLRVVLAFLAFLGAGGGGRLVAQFEVAPVFATPSDTAANVDSCAVWVPPDAREPLLFVTEKDGDRIQVLRADTGEPYPPRPFLGDVPDGSLPGELNRPNGVWVLYHVPFAGGFSDVLLVTDQRNFRVQIFRLPELEYFGQFGTGELGKCYGLAWYQDGTDYFVFVTDNIPPEAFPGKIKKYRLRPEGDFLGADLVFGVGSSSGNPPLPNVESIVVDLPLDRLHVCGDEGGKFNRVFHLDGSYTGITYGDPQFEYDQEGINLYDTGAGTGYLIVSDQYRNGRPNQFELFDRSSLDSLGNFESPDDGSLVTRNVDGAYLEQRPLSGFPDGALFAVNDDRNTHAYDWTDIAEAAGLEIVPLDRPFPLDSPGSTPGGGRPSRSSLWFHDSSWWGVLARQDGLALFRLEDGTFRMLGSVGAGEAASVWSSGADLIVLAAGTDLSLYRFTYASSSRIYRLSAGPVEVSGIDGPLADLAVETGADGSPSQVWVAGITGGELKVRRAESLPGAWSEDAIPLGSASAVLPRWVRDDGAMGVVWAQEEAVNFRLHPDGGAPGDWSPLEPIAATAVSALSAARGPGAEILVAGELVGGSGALWVRSASGAWSEEPLSWQMRDPALVVTPSGGSLHVLYAAQDGARRLIYNRPLDASGWTFGEPSLSTAWPGVSQQAILVPAFVDDSAPDLVAVSRGDDGLGYFARLPLPAGEDNSAPITLQHDPPPDASGVQEGATIFFRIIDRGTGVDRSKLKLYVNGAEVVPRVRGVPRSLLVTYSLEAGLGPDVNVRIEAADLAAAPHVMTPFEWGFRVGSPSGPDFRRGDVNDDGDVDISDAVSILLYLFTGSVEPACEDAADTTDDGGLDVSDSIRLLRYLFLGENGIAAPGLSCGGDPTPDSLGCGATSSCP